jgi:hypothetical protein
VKCLGDRQKEYIKEFKCYIKHEKRKAPLGNLKNEIPEI